MTLGDATIYQIVSSDWYVLCSTVCQNSSKKPVL